MIEHYNIRSVIRKRAGQHSFHLVADRYLRVEFRNLVSNQTIGPFAYEGDVIVTCYGGAFRIQMEGQTIDLVEFDQAVVPIGSLVTVACDVAGSLQLIWVPPSAGVRQPDANNNP